MNYVKRGGVYLIVAIFSWLSLRIITLIFRDNSYSKDVISINNRNVYMVFSYFWFFIGLPMGFFSAILRILKAMAVGALMLPRVDHSVMPDGFQRLDRGFNAYICYLHVETAYRNPVLRVFCQMLVDETQNNPRNVQTLGINRVRKWTFSAQARARWFLALTLARNPQLASDRKPDVQAPQPAQAARYGDVMIEIDQFCADNTALIQDK
ncbi:stimulated by retinoic acid gene 6 -like [Paramuricea clavata]|uniref:Stimulated by retinoic acid gene 6 -like n=1 Tax=Paramuricea clavata TaxID=317549 RepID=A0A7D9EJ53_PARCT|nr:stimulated by retinoic acid gene 6 -like [Paramuricea clavata]